MKKLLYILALIITSINVMAQQPLNQRGNTGEQWYETIVAALVVAYQFCSNLNY